jgi:hypothetical protein
MPGLRENQNYQGGGMIGEKIWDPTGCQSAMDLPQESYWSSHENAKHRHRQGLRQTHCSMCDRWRWPHEQCSDFKHS